MKRSQEISSSEFFSGMPAMQNSLGSPVLVLTLKVTVFFFLLLVSVNVYKNREIRIIELCMKLKY